MLLWKEVKWKKQNTAERIYLFHWSSVAFMYYLSSNHTLVELSIPTTVNRGEFQVIGHIFVIIHEKHRPCNETDFNHLTAFADF